MIETYYPCKCMCHPALEQCGSCCEKFKKPKYQAVHRESLGEWLEKLQTRIEKLENHICFNKDNRHDLNQALSAIQHEYKDMFSKINAELKEYNEIILGGCPIEIDKLNRKIPHKCPLCEGNKVRIYLNTDIENDNYKSSIQENLCHVCEGKGIIWG